MTETTSVTVRACRNCGAPIHGDYCASCGQETKLALPTAREFLREAAGRYVALDGRLWRSLFALLTRPGFLTREYFAGRRRRYIRPGRLFLVLSLALFALLRIVLETPIVIGSESDNDGVPASGAAKAQPSKSAQAEKEPMRARVDDDFDVDLGDVERWSPELGKRLQRFKQLPGQEKAEQLYAGALRYGPYAMFALLPGFALLLQVVYAGRRRRYPERPRRYAQHLVFAAHNHAFLCLVGIVAGAVPVSAARTVLALWALVYFAWSMHAVYGGRWGGVIARGFVVAIAYLVLFAFATVGLIIAAALLR